jgi:hypothetical protein
VDPDIAKAKQRLLASKVFSPKFFDYSECSVCEEEELLVKVDPVILEARHHLNTSEKSLLLSEGTRKESHTLVVGSGNELDKHAQMPIEETKTDNQKIGEHDENDDDVADEEEAIVKEETSLLFHSPEQGSTFAEVLRPLAFSRLLLPWQKWNDKPKNDPRNEKRNDDKCIPSFVDFAFEK